MVRKRQEENNISTDLVQTVIVTATTPTPARVAQPQHPVHAVRWTPSNPGSIGYGARLRILKAIATRWGMKIGAHGNGDYNGDCLFPRSATTFANGAGRRHSGIQPRPINVQGGCHTDPTRGGSTTLPDSYARLPERTGKQLRQIVFYGLKWRNGTCRDNIVFKVSELAGRFSVLFLFLPSPLVVHCFTHLSAPTKRREAAEVELRSRGAPLLGATGELLARWRALAETAEEEEQARLHGRLLEERGTGSREYWRGVEELMRKSKAAQLKAAALQAAPEHIATVASPQHSSRASAAPGPGHERLRVVDVDDEDEGEDELDLDMFAKLVLEEFSVSFHNLDTFRDLLDLFGIPPEQEIRGRAFRAWERAVQVRRDEAVARRMQEGPRGVVVDVEESQQGAGAAGAAAAGRGPPPKRARSWSELQGPIAVDSQGASEQGGPPELLADAPAATRCGAAGAVAGTGPCCPASASAGGRDEALAEPPLPGAAADEDAASSSSVIEASRGNSFGPDSDSDSDLEIAFPSARVRAPEPCLPAGRPLAAMGAASRLPALGLSWAALARRGAAQDAAAGLMCQCEMQDNHWRRQHQWCVLTHVQDLPQALQDPQHPSTAWVLRQGCAEDAGALPNSEAALDIGDVLRLRDGALQGGGGQGLEGLCLPGQVALAMVCTQQWLVKGSLMGIVKWAGRMTELLSVCMDCMDAHSPLPLRRADFERYVAVFQQGIAKPDTPGFLAAFAFPFRARRKELAEAGAPLHECLPLRDPTCFPRGTLNALESCTLCCTPQMGPGGNPACWDGGFTHERCCQAPAPPPPAAAAAQGQCQGQEERNRELRASLEEQAAASLEQGRAIAGLREELRACAQGRGEEAAAGREAEGQGGARGGLEEELRVCAEELDRERKSGAEKDAKNAALLLDVEHAQKAREASSAARDQCSQKVEEEQAEAAALKKRADGALRLGNEAAACLASSGGPSREAAVRPRTLPARQHAGGTTSTPP
ncbi:unnamed protein product [Prorocentrum cordatum]|uniref:Uncharacterized protein n=1 Tax=Prorocentrum cordatum TaxID=2364126 RepID=A0ABN9U295_9DINO|nr:unnamed protein product [Polarella glacialis]